MKHILILLISIFAAVSAFGRDPEQIHAPDSLAAKTVAGPVQESPAPKTPVDQAQERLARIQNRLAELGVADSTYMATVDISMGRQSLSELLRNVALVAGVNLSLKGIDNIQVTCNFSRAKITDLLLFLCGEHDLDLNVVGNIVSIRPRFVPPPPPKPIGVSCRRDSLYNYLSFNLSGDRLPDVTRKITDLTGTNFFVPHTLSEQRLTGYIVDMPFGDAIKTIASMNGMDATEDGDNVWAFYPVAGPDGSRTAANSAQAYRRRTPFSPTELSIDSLGTITAQIGRGSVQDIITDLCEQQGLNYFFVTPINGQTSIYVRETDFETLLDVMLLGTDFSYYRQDGIYIFGAAAGREQFTTVTRVDMRYRSVKNLSNAIPEALKSGIQIHEFHDLNSIILSGDRKKVSRVENFLRSVDVRVPMVTIEIIIADVSKNRGMDIGVEAGFGKSGVASGGTLGGGVDVMLNASSINSLINSFNGFGSVNLGKVGSGFYFGLQFLEENGIIDMQSTPKLSTLNGHEATLKSGETRYYKEVSNNYYGSQIPISTESYMWKSVDANLDIKITPFVSEDKHITLDIEIDQTEFTVQTDKEAPPGTATRSFKSLVRVQNEEMVLLGGLDQNVKEKSNKGLPWIARVPVLRWLFGKSKDKKQEHKLNVFIKPTLIE